jgi:hypothetical protein
MQTDLASIINEIRGWHRERCFAMESRKISDLRLGAELRTRLGWKRDLPKVESDAIKKRALELIVLGEKVCKGKSTGADDAAFVKSASIIIASIQGRKIWDELEGNATEHMERLARSLPVWPAWGEGVRGFGARSLAVIIGEAGDLSNYPKKGHLWKRMGLSPIEKDGLVQSGASWRKGGLSKDDWIAAGYSMVRRSRMFVIGDVMVKVGDHYRQVYLDRKEYERSNAQALGLTVCPAARIPAKRKDEFVSDGHIHRRAQRYMEKRLLRDLWQAWRRAESTMAKTPTAKLPADEIEGEAKASLPKKAMRPLQSPQPYFA